MSDRPRPSGSSSNRSPSTKDRDVSKGYPRDRDVGSRYAGRDRSRSRSRSPRRERDSARYGDKGYNEDTRRNGAGGGDYRNPNRDYDRSTTGPSAPSGGRGGGGGGGGSGYDVSYRGRGGHEYESGGYRGRGGGGGGSGRYGGGEERDRPLDRRAIEEGRRRREEERAQGRVFDDAPPAGAEDRKPSTVPTGPKRGVRAPREDSGSNDRLGSASPYPDSSNGRGRGDSREGETRVKLEEGEEMEQDGEEDEEGNEEDAMAAMLGFGGFGSTKNKAVEQNVEGAADVKKQRTWRQYMNRRGGFNRPLDRIK